MVKSNCVTNEDLNKVEESVDEVLNSIDDVDKALDGVKKSLHKCDDGLDSIISQIEYMNKLLNSKHDGGKG